MRRAVVRPWGRGGRRLRPRAERGVAAVEFALVLPLLMALLCGTIELGDALHTQIALIAATRDGARFGSRGARDDEIAALVRVNLGHLRDSGPVVTVTREGPPQDETLRVTACLNHRLLINYPLLPLPNPVRMCATTVMAVLKVIP
jgi:Flp pilus assembly protein TadG